MVSVADAIGLLVILFAHTAIAALATRFFRVRLHTSWGAAIYTALLVPFVLLVGTFVLAGVAGLGPNLGSPAAVVGLVIALPMAIGVAFDFFWMPSPEEVDLPDTQQPEGPRSRRGPGR